MQIMTLILRICSFPLVLMYCKETTQFSPQVELMFGSMLLSVYANTKNILIICIIIVLLSLYCDERFCVLLVAYSYDTEVGIALAQEEEKK